MVLVPAASSGARRCSLRWSATIATLSDLVTGSPIAAALSHAVMHGAAVLHGMVTAVQLPPHY